MFGKIPRINPRDLRKQLLIAESEINRVELVQESRAMAEEVRHASSRVKSMCSFGSVAALLTAGISAFREIKTVLNVVKPSWLETAVKGAQVVGNLWMAFRARG